MWLDSGRRPSDPCFSFSRSITKVGVITSGSFAKINDECTKNHLDFCHKHWSLLKSIINYSMTVKKSIGIITQTEAIVFIHRCNKFWKLLYFRNMDFNESASVKFFTLPISVKNTKLKRYRFDWTTNFIPIKCMKYFLILPLYRLWFSSHQYTVCTTHNLYSLIPPKKF